MDLTNNKPPQDIQIERMVLCSILNDKYAQNASFGLIKNADIFYLPAHRIIYENIRSLYEQSLPISTKLLFVELKKKGIADSVGGAQFITDLGYAGVLNEKIETYILVLKEYWIKRRLIDISIKNYQNAVSDTVDVFELLDESSKSMDGILEELNGESSQTMAQISARCLAETQEAMNNGGVSGISTGLADWDKQLGGLKPNNLIVIAARPGMGKSALALSLMKNTMLQGKKSLFFSLEMADTQLVHRLISSESGVSYSRAIDGKVSEKELTKMSDSVGVFCNDLIEIVVVSGINAQQIKAKAKSVKALKGLDVIIIDYLQLIVTPQKKGRQERNLNVDIGDITTGLKLLAKELNIPIILLAQLNRDVEKRADKRPQLSDLRDSGSIEQDADIVIFQLRPEYYGIKNLEDGTSTENLMINIVAKNRGGGVGDIKNYCHMATNRIEDFGYIENTQIELPETNPNAFNWGERPVIF